MPSSTEDEIRRALAAEALGYEPPDDLASRTLAAAESGREAGAVARIRGRFEGRKLRREGRAPKWAFAGAALAILIGLYGVGYVSLSSSMRRPGEESPVMVDERAVGPDIGRSRPGTGTAAPAPGMEGPVAPEVSRDAGAGGDGGSATATVPGQEDAQARRGASSPQDSIAPVPPGPGPAPNAAAGPGVIRTGDMQVEVKKGSFGSVWARAMTIAGKHGGMVAASSADQVEGRLSRGTLTVRVPASKLDAAITDFQRLGKVVHLTSSSTDVSGQLVDYDARIRAAQARELQLLELLRQARSVSDSLQVGTALSEVRTEIERLQAERANLQSQVDLAALNVSLYEPQAAPEYPTPVQGRLSGAWQRALDAAALTLSTIVVGAGFVLPLAVLALVVWGAFRLRRRSALR